MRPQRWLPPFAVVGLTLLVFAPVLRNGFVNYDDALTIACNAHLAPVTWTHVRFWWAGPVLELYTPLTYSAWGAISLVAQTPTDPVTGISQNPFVFHLVALVTHVLATWTVYLLLRLLVGRRWPAAAGAIVFGIHPLQVETVAWATAFSGGLAGALGLAALYQYCRCARDGRLGLRYGVATLLFTLAAFAKPSAIVMPLLAATLERVMFRRPWLEVLRKLSPWFAVSLIVAIVTSRAQPTARFDTPYPLIDRLFVCADSFDFYCAKLFVPWPLGPNYHRTPLAVLHANWVLFAWLIPLGLLLLFKVLRSPAGVVAGALCFLFSLGPTLGLFRFTFAFLISTVADRYAYLALFGPALAIAWMLAHPAAAVSRRPRPVIALCVVVALGMSALSLRQVCAWRDTHALYALQPYGIVRDAPWPGHLIQPTRSHRQLQPR